MAPNLPPVSASKQRLKPLSKLYRGITNHVQSRHPELSLILSSMAEENKQQAESTPDFSRKHQLEHKWTLWFDNPSTRQTLNRYGQGLRPVYSFDTVEDFWW